MAAPLGYLSLLSEFLEYVISIGLLALFFIERHSYGRQSLDGMTVLRLIVYNVISFGFYGMYWRLKASFALSSRDRLPPLLWIVLLILLFLLLFSPQEVLLGVILWNFIIRFKWQKATHTDLSWFFTLVFGHLYLAAAMNGNTHLLPVDFRQINPDRRQSFVKGYILVLIPVFLLVTGIYGVLFLKRSHEFHELPAHTQTTDFYGRTHTDRKDALYHVDAEGHMQVLELVEDEAKKKKPLWLEYSQAIKIKDGQRYSYKWFGCTQVEPAISMEAEAIEAADFKQRKAAFEENEAFPMGWQLGEFIRSPWDCEWKG